MEHPVDVGEQHIFYARLVSFARVSFARVILSFCFILGLFTHQLLFFPPAKSDTCPPFPFVSLIDLWRRRLWCSRRLRRRSKQHCFRRLSREEQEETVYSIVAVHSRQSSGAFQLESEKSLVFSLSR
jgi:hypothetical protein